ncbi:MAG: hypothetical protein R3B06_18315 [Kofleriaceae bacterium]
MSDAPILDSDLDDRVRAAAGALAALAAPARLDALAARIEHAIATPDPAVATPYLEQPMTSDTDNKSGPASSVPASAVTPRADGAGRTEDSGLHDIKALAKDTRKRMSARITSQHDIDERLLSASHSGLRAVALPEPALVVALPAVPASLAELKASAPASERASVAASVSAIEAARPKKRTALWVGLGGAGVAAAAVVALVLSSGGGDKATKPAAAGAAGDRVAVAEPAMPTAAAGMAPGEAAPARGAPAAAPHTGASDDSAAAEETTGAKAQAVAAPPAAAAPKAEPEADKERDRPGSKADPVTATATRSGDSKGAGGKVAEPKPDGKAVSTTVAATGKTAPAGSAKPTPPPKPTGEKSIEDLLNDASGGAAKPKDDDVATDSGPQKKSLESREIKAGLSAVAGKAQGCFGKYGVAGLVKVKVTIAPSGTVTKADATGSFAGTPTGGCVADAAKGATFPAWSGAPMSISYSYTLQE